MQRADVITVGGGVIGLSISVALAERGLRVTVIDPRPGGGASSVAAGMLAPVTEAAYGEEALSQLALRAADAWPAFAERLEDETGYSVGYRREGTLLVATDAGDAAALRDLLDYHRELELESRWLLPSEARATEPLLAPSIRGALFAPGDGQVDNRRLLAALAMRARQLGVLDQREPVIAVAHDRGRVQGVETTRGRIGADVVIVAAGYASGSIAGLPAPLPPVRPVKGQILRLRARSAAALPLHTVRALVQGSSVYVVPRSDGQVVIGATVEDLGAELALTAGGVYTLLRDAIRVLPGLVELELTEASSGLRPGSLDNAAIVGQTEVGGLLLACGHYRNGVLFAPLTTQVIASILEEGRPPEWAWPFDPSRAAATLPQS